MCCSLSDNLKSRDASASKKKKSCPLCSANIEHQRCQTSASNPIQQCQLCGEFKSSQVKLREHMRASHPLEKLFNCDKCAYKCNWLPNLNVHKNAKHEKVKIQCDKCDFSSTWKVAVNEHMRSKHGIFQKNTKYKDLMEFKEVICENCGFKGTSKMAMNLHSKSGCDRWVWWFTNTIYFQTATLCVGCTISIQQRKSCWFLNSPKNFQSLNFK